MWPGAVGILGITRRGEGGRVFLRVWARSRSVFGRDVPKGVVGRCRDVGIYTGPVSVAGAFSVAMCPGISLGVVGMLGVTRRGEGGESFLRVWARSRSVFGRDVPKGVVGRCRDVGIYTGPVSVAGAFSVAMCPGISLGVVGMLGVTRRGEGGESFLRVWARSRSVFGRDVPKGVVGRCWDVGIYKGPVSVAGAFSVAMYPGAWLGVVGMLGIIGREKFLGCVLLVVGWTGTFSGAVAVLEIRGAVLPGQGRLLAMTSSLAW